MNESQVVIAAPGLTAQRTIPAIPQSHSGRETSCPGQD